MRRLKPWRSCPARCRYRPGSGGGVRSHSLSFPGITGRLYQQFALTIAISVVFSAFNALTLSPALASLLLRPTKRRAGARRKFFGWFNRYFGRRTEVYVRLCGGISSKGRARLWC